MVPVPCFPQTASAAAVAAQQATAAGLRAAAAAVSAAAAATVFPNGASTSQSDYLSSIGVSNRGHDSHQNDSNGSVTFSRVVHLRNIPSDMTELELVHFCMPFGKLVNYLMLKGKNQAFVEYEEDSGAQTIVNVAQACPMAIRGRTIFCQYSTHQELKTERKGATKNGSIFGDTMLSVGFLHIKPSKVQWEIKVHKYIRGLCRFVLRPFREMSTFRCTFVGF